MRSPDVLSWHQSPLWNDLTFCTQPTDKILLFHFQNKRRTGKQAVQFQKMKLWHYISQAFLAAPVHDHTPQEAPSTSLTAGTMTNSSNSTVYFGYGSNLWRSQMGQRCPTSAYLGIARLNNYKWIINERGYANVVQINRRHSKADAAKSYEDEVWGLVYTLQTNDEKRLDRNEGVPFAYTKEVLECDFWAVEDGAGPANVTEKPKQTGMLVYINRDMVDPSEPKREYIYRMNMGINDAVKEGVPKSYVERVMRKFIPENELVMGEVENAARKQAAEFEDEK